MLQTVQVLRGVAATVVVGHHMLLGIVDEGHSWPLGEALFRRGGIGVDIFFVISGFIIFYSSFKGSRPTPGVFLTNRVFRVYPPYLFIHIILLSLLLALWVATGDADRLPSLGELLKTLLLWPMEPTDYMLVIAWTLSLELIFYFIFAVTALGSGIMLFFGAMSAWYLMSVAGLFICQDSSGWCYPALNPVILEFIFGAVIAWVFLRGGTRWHLPAFISGAIMILAVILINPEKTWLMRREFIDGVASAILVYGAVGLRWTWPKVLVAWGESSYVLYLSHLVVFMIVGRGLELTTGFNIYSNVYSGVGVIAFAVIAAYVLTAQLERPYQRWYKRRFAQSLGLRVSS